jgi:phospholipase/carboxylesterase
VTFCAGADQIAWDVPAQFQPLSNPMTSAIVVQRPPAASATPAELLLLFHGVGASAENMLPLAQAVASRRPAAWVISVRSPEPSDLGSGWQWFSVRGITESNRPERVSAAMPDFLRTVSSWQRETGVAPAATTIIGFSQGAIMALEATQQLPSPAARVIAIAGRFAQAPRIAPAGVRVHLLHGEQDAVMPIESSVNAQAALLALNVPATLDRFAGLGHGIDARAVDRVLGHLAVPGSDAPA